MIEEIKVSFVRSKTAAETFIIPRYERFDFDGIKQSVCIQFLELFSKNFKMYYKGIFNNDV